MPKPVVQQGKNLVNDLTLKQQNLNKMFSIQRCFKTNQELAGGTPNLLAVKI